MLPDTHGLILNSQLHVSTIKKKQNNTFFLLATKEQLGPSTVY